MEVFRYHSPLSRLIEQGKAIAKEKEGSTNALELVMWMAEVRDVLEMLLPRESHLLQEAVAYIDSVKKAAPSNQAPDYIKAVEVVSDMIIRAKRLSTLTVYKNNTEELWQEFERMFSERYMKSRWFLATTGLLAALVGFALFGVFQIQNIKVDIRKVADNALSKAIEQLKTTTSDAAAVIESEKKKLLGELVQDKNAASGALKDRIASLAPPEEVNALLREAAEGNIEQLVNSVNTASIKSSNAAMRIAMIEDEITGLEPSVRYIEQSMRDMSVRADKEPAFFRNVLYQVRAVQSWLLYVAIALAGLLVLSLFLSVIAIRKARR